ncbi:DUF1810 domain-containing protein [Novosphingobium lentum]|uniref:DUF1810 domain-containing protein n=1 Tax=Novosphingobium lentum TaxID=145287 RepID=UPI00082B7A29|nr:DUF1810 domain-containing protein [Novosphingobium lentum]
MQAVPQSIPQLRSAYDLDRFVAAQAETFDHALAELRQGAKRSHWMWFAFPQIAGLGSSAMAQRFAIADLGEAQAYLAHPVLGARYDEACAALAKWVGLLTAAEILGPVDAMKLSSSLTLFEHAASESRSVRYAELLAGFFGGLRDERTRDILRADQSI